MEFQCQEILHAGDGPLDEYVETVMNVRSPEEAACVFADGRDQWEIDDQRLCDFDLDGSIRHVYVLGHGKYMVQTNIVRKHIVIHHEPEAK